MEGTEGLQTPTAKRVNTVVDGDSFPTGPQLRWKKKYKINKIKNYWNFCTPIPVQLYISIHGWPMFKKNLKKK